jgi:hypothetical protein
MDMPRDLIPFSTDDVSALAKSLRGQLASREAPPSHVEMLNMLARAAGHRNFQHFRAQAGARDRIERTVSAAGAADAVDHALVLRALRYFDDEGRFASWPARTNLQNLCLWAVWARIPAERTFDEREINAVLRSLHRFGDQAILRRTLCVRGLVTRTADGRIYRRIEQAPPPEALALIRHLGSRHQ